jgi:hypothetical protein
MLLLALEPLFHSSNSQNHHRNIETESLQPPLGSQGSPTAPPPPMDQLEAQAERLRAMMVESSARSAVEKTLEDPGESVPVPPPSLRYGFEWKIDSVYNAELESFRYVFLITEGYTLGVWYGSYAKTQG